MVDNFFGGKFFVGGFFGGESTQPTKPLGIGWSAARHRRLRKDDDMVIQLVTKSFVHVQNYLLNSKGVV